MADVGESKHYHSDEHETRAEKRAEKKLDEKSAETKDVKQAKEAKKVKEVEEVEEDIKEEVEEDFKKVKKSKEEVKKRNGVKRAGEQSDAEKGGVGFDLSDDKKRGVDKRGSEKSEDGVIDAALNAALNSAADDVLAPASTSTPGSATSKSVTDVSGTKQGGATGRAVQVDSIKIRVESAYGFSA